MKQIEGGFTLVALMDGTTINGILRVEGLPLIQRYNKGTNHFIPDFEKVAENEQPTAVIILRDSATGMVLTPSTHKWFYNGAQLTFSASHLSTNEGLVETFEEINNYSATIGAKTYQLPALRVKKNLVPISGLDNDRLSISGTVAVNGRNIEFQEIGQEVVIQEATGNAYDVVITDTKGSALTEDNESLICTANLYKDGIEVTDYSGYVFQWVKIPSEEQLGKARTQTINTSMVDGVLKVRCDISDGKAVVASGITQITDFSDPYYVDIQITGQGVVGNALRPGQKCVVKPVARRRKDGSINAAFNSWKFNIKNNAGADFKVASKPGATFTADSVEVTSADIANAGGGISGSVSSTI